MLRKLLGTSLASAVAVVLGAGPANAGITNWTVQSASSSLAISGALSSGGSFLASLTSQGTNTVNGPGLTTTFSGQIDTHQNVSGVTTDGWSGNPSDIEFLNTTNLVANNSGDWDPTVGGPIGTAPANYGGNVLLGFLGGANLAVRNLAASLQSGVIPISGQAFAAQSFNGPVTVSITSATADYRGFGPVGGALGSGTLTEGIVGQSAEVGIAGTINYSGGGLGGTATMTVPINFNFSLVVSGADTTADPSDDIGVYIALIGNIAATADTANVPEANSLVLLGMAGSAIGFMGYRRRMANKS